MVDLLVQLLRPIKMIRYRMRGLRPTVADDRLVTLIPDDGEESTLLLTDLTAGEPPLQLDE